MTIGYKILTLLITCILVNGALFNRIGGRIAEQSYVNAIYDLLNIGNAEKTNHLKIKISKNTCPVNIPVQTNINIQIIADSYLANYKRYNKVTLICLHQLIRKFRVNYSTSLLKAHKQQLLRPPILLS